MIKGSMVYLCPIEKEDLETLRNWRNLPEYRKYFREYKEISKEMQLDWYNTKVINDNSTIMFAIRNITDHTLLGCCGLCYINWVHRYADLSLYIGWKEVYIDDLGFAKEACNLLFDYAFNELGLNKIWTEIYEFDEKKYLLYKMLGFKQDGNLRQNYFFEGRWWDSKILSLLCNEYRIYLTDNDDSL